MGTLAGAHRRLNLCATGKRTRKYGMINVNEEVLPVEQTMFTNEVILSWLQYFSLNVEINLAKLKMLDITGRIKT